MKHTLHTIGAYRTTPSPLGMNETSGCTARLVATPPTPWSIRTPLSARDSGSLTRAPLPTSFKSVSLSERALSGVYHEYDVSRINLDYQSLPCKGKIFGKRGGNGKVNGNIHIWVPV